MKTNSLILKLKPILSIPIALATLLSAFTVTASAGHDAGEPKEDVHQNLRYLVKTLPTGCQPKGMKANSKSHLLYVAEMCGHIDENGNKVPSVSVYDLMTLTGPRIIETPMGAKSGIMGNTEVEFSANENLVFIARAEGDKNTKVYPGYGMISVYDQQSEQLFKFIPVQGMGSKIIARRPKTADGREVIYVANYFSDDISVLDVTNVKKDGSLDGRSNFVKTIKLYSRNADKKKRGFKLAPRGVGFSADGSLAYILATETGGVIILDSMRHVQIGEIDPIPDNVLGRPVNIRHIITTVDSRDHREWAFLGHMRGSAVSKLNLTLLNEKIKSRLAALDGDEQPESIHFNASIWNEVLVPFSSKPGSPKILSLERYPSDHPNFPNQNWELAHPNTIALDAVYNRFLVVSFRTTSSKDYYVIDPKIKGKVDILDTWNGQLVESLVAGTQPTALELTPDNKYILSAGFKDKTLYIFDFEAILKKYLNQ